MPGKVLEAEFQHFFNSMSVMSWVGHFLAVAFFGILVPLRQGLDFLDITYLLAYACLPCMFAAPLVAESVAGRRTLPPEWGYMAQVLTPFLFATVWNLVILISAFTVVNATHWMGRLVLPHRILTLNVLLLSLAATWFSATGTAWLSLHVPTAALAKAHSRRLFLLILVLVLMWARLAPHSWKSTVESRLTPSEISYFVIPLSAVLALAGFALLRAGTTHRAEESQGPVFKLQ
ncbi:MAG TPA: hypothetical protein VM120_28350 [Bryobacteraceae bacterium]|nr:hypothetical protein [Bryobacteraceae bacterium]